MTRIPTHGVEDAPEASRTLLRELIQFSPTGRPLNMHAQMAHAPAVLTAYVSIRKAGAQLGTLDQPVRAALMLAAATADGSEYAQAVISALALRSGWSQEEVRELREGRDVGDARTRALTSLIREAAGNHGHVSDPAWERAVARGWNDEQLAEAFAYLGLAVYTSYFLNYAGTELDLPVAVVR